MEKITAPRACICEQMTDNESKNLSLQFMEVRFDSRTNGCHCRHAHELCLQWHSRARRDVGSDVDGGPEMRLELVPTLLERGDEKTKCSG